MHSKTSDISLSFLSSNTSTGHHCNSWEFCGWSSSAGLCCTLTRSSQVCCQQPLVGFLYLCFLSLPEYFPWLILLVLRLKSVPMFHISPLVSSFSISSCILSPTFWFYILITVILILRFLFFFDWLILKSSPPNLASNHHYFLTTAQSVWESFVLESSPSPASNLHFPHLCLSWPIHSCTFSSTLSCTPCCNVLSFSPCC